jgi:hypothetical protein
MAPASLPENPLRMSVWPVASQTRTPLGIGIMAAPARQPEQLPAPAPRPPANNTLAEKSLEDKLDDAPLQGQCYRETCTASYGIVRRGFET